MSGMTGGGIPHPSAIEVSQDDPVARANSLISEKHADLLQKPEIRERVWGLNARTDTTVTYEEYRHWADVEREIERLENVKYKEIRGPLTFQTAVKDRFRSGLIEEQKRRASVEAVTEKDPNQVTTVTQNSSTEDIMKVTDAEWRQAARALRTAGWGTIFYLVTTDILGWSSAPYVFSTVGFGPGVALFVIFGLAAGFAGWSLWQVYIRLDSARFPMVSFGDPYLRLFGVWPRRIINVAQALMQFMSVAVVLLGNSILLSQIAKFKICFVVVCLIVMIVGIISGSIRGLQKIGWICNLSVWFNIANFIIIMVASTNGKKDWDAIFGSTIFGETIGKAPVRTFAGTPPIKYQGQGTGFAAQFSAVGTMVYAYAGALLFVAFMAEMRHPMDFWKGMLCAQCFICTVYILFGAFVYGHWGQYSLFNINTVVLPYSLQTAGNVLSLLTGWFAVFLYFNVGMKTVYQEVFMEVLHFPALYTKKGRMCWYILGPIYWIIAFIVAAAIPDLGGLVGFLGGLLALNFTYTFPVLLYLGYNMQEGARLEGEGFDQYTGVTTKHDSGMKRHMRGFMKKWYINIPVVLFLMAALATSGMATWGSVLGLQGYWKTHFAAANFKCCSPAAACAAAVLKPNA